MTCYLIRQFLLISEMKRNIFSIIKIPIKLSRRVELKEPLKYWGFEIWPRKIEKKRMRFYEVTIKNRSIYRDSCTTVKHLIELKTDLEIYDFITTSQFYEVIWNRDSEKYEICYAFVFAKTWFILSIGSNLFWILHRYEFSRSSCNFLKRAWTC